MNQAVIIGSGNIGRGLNAEILYKNKYNIAFLDVSSSMINMINSNSEYTINKINTQSKQEIKNFTGINILEDQDKAIKTLAHSEVIFISIGISNLIKIAPLIYKAILYKFDNKINHAVNIVAVENGVKASSKLKQQVIDLFQGSIKKENYLEFISFSNCAVDRIVPQQSQENLNVDVEDFYELVIDKNTWQGKPLKFVDYSNKINNYILRKLFMLNGTHTFIAWQGIKNNFKYIHEFINWPKIVADVKDLLDEYGQILVQLYNFSEMEINIYKKNIIKRLVNKSICDDVNRVGRSVLRKISANDRFILPLKIAYENGLSFSHILQAVSLPFELLTFEDSENRLLKQHINSYGINDAVDNFIQTTSAVKKIIIDYL